MSSATAPSYTRIDYSVRPAKAIERRMMVDIVRRLDRTAALVYYRYVGFGSLYFSDFSLFHKVLGIRELISIEREVDDELRFRFNLPYAPIELRFGDAADVLPSLSWDERSIVWLDYDGRLKLDKLDDLAFLVRNVAPGSVVAVTVNVQPTDKVEGRLARACSTLDTLVPLKYNDENLGGWGCADLAWDVISERIRTALDERNTGKSQSAKVGYKQLFHFRYRDGARMLTTGGMFYDSPMEAHVGLCAFEDFHFCKNGAEAFEIVIPRLTLREMRLLDSLLPSGEYAQGAVDVGVPADDARNYSDLYRYFPKFAETEP